MSTKKTVIIPTPAEHGFKNPLKGLRGNIHALRSEFNPEQKNMALTKTYFDWNELERTIDDDVDYIKDFCNRAWAGFREHNVKVIPRVALQWPNHGDHTKATRITGCFPSDMLPDTLDRPEFLFRVRNLIEKLGKAWDEDDRVAYIECGIYGLWGEEHEDTMSKVALKNLAEAYLKAFPHKKLMLRKPKNGAHYPTIGTYWDSFAHIDEEMYANDAINFLHWETAVMGGEMAWNWGRYWIQPGEGWDNILTSPDHLPRFLEYLYWQHNNHLGMPGYGKLSEAAQKGLDEFHKISGYRYILEKVAYGAENGKLEVEFDVKNIGASPMYYQWPVQAYLLDENKNPVWHGDFNCNLMDWMPGDDYDFGRHTYGKPAATNKVTGCFDISAVKPGKYVLALAVPDPANGKPNLRFATTNYFKGGYTAIGWVGVGCEVENAAIDPKMFDDLYTDNSLCY